MFNSTKQIIKDANEILAKINADMVERDELKEEIVKAKEFSAEVGQKMLDCEIKTMAVLRGTEQLGLAVAKNHRKIKEQIAECENKQVKIKAEMAKL